MADHPTKGRAGDGGVDREREPKRKSLVPMLVEATLRRREMAPWESVISPEFPARAPTATFFVGIPRTSGSRTPLRVVVQSRERDSKHWSTHDEQRFYGEGTHAARVDGLGEILRVKVGFGPEEEFDLDACAHVRIPEPLWAQPRGDS